MSKHDKKREKKEKKEIENEINNETNNELNSELNSEIKNEPKKKKKKGLKIFLIIILLLAVLGAGGYFAYKLYWPKNEIVAEEIEEVVEEKVVVKKEVQIFKGNERPIAVMIDNHKQALPQGGLNDAYIVYEIIVEGGESRLMAIFKGEEPEKIGPVRSSRHYFLDYALENDAIYTHYGWSPQAQSDISSLKVNNINGLVESTETFWRVSDKKAPHNVATTIEKLKKVAEKKGYRMTSNEKSVLNYVTDEVDLAEGESAEKVTIPYYGTYNTVVYEYDSETMRYQRFSKGVKESDWSTKEETTTKNIIITFVKNSDLKDGDNKGRQTLDNVETLDGYYITNGRAIKITCEKHKKGV